MDRANKVDFCRICNASLKEFMTFGKMPIANGFLKEEDFDNEYFFELAPAFCTECSTLQLVDQPNPEAMFHEDYAFFTRQSQFMQTHFKKYAEWVSETYLRDKSDFVVELGCNDGALLENFAKNQQRHLGVDPSANVVEVAKSHGVDAIVAFFGKETAERVRAEHGPAKALLSANVMCHLPDLNDIAQGAAALLDEDGVLVFEDPYLGDMLSKVSYDQLYDEHVFIFSALSVSNIFGRNGFELIDVLPQPTHGGSMRYVLGKKGSHKVSVGVTDLLAKELALGYDKIETYETFRNNCEASKQRLKKLISQAKEEGKTVCGYGATSKSTTILNYCGIKASDIDFISDTTPIKQDKYSPGVHIPIKSYEYFQSNPADVIILFAWNHAKEIMAKEGGAYPRSRWITHLKDEVVFG